MTGTLVEFSAAVIVFVMAAALLAGVLNRIVVKRSSPRVAWFASAAVLLVAPVAGRYPPLLAAADLLAFLVVLFLGAFRASLPVQPHR